MTGSMTWASGRLIESTGCEKSTNPVLSAVHPTTRPPPAATMLPSPSKLKLPARVYVRTPPVSRTKKPSPWMARSVLRPVTWLAPWVKTPVMEPTRVPRPICIGFVPPMLPVGEPLPCRVWASVSWNVTTEDLKPAVLTLAMLLPTTSIIVWWERNPEIPENIERIMVGYLPCRGSRPWVKVGCRSFDVPLILSADHPLSRGVRPATSLAWLHLQYVVDGDPIRSDGELRPVDVVPNGVDLAGDPASVGTEGGDLLARQSDRQ